MLITYVSSCLLLESGGASAELDFGLELWRSLSKRMLVQQLSPVWVLHLVRNKLGASQKQQVLPCNSFLSLTLYLNPVSLLEYL